MSEIVEILIEKLVTSKWSIFVIVIVMSGLLANSRVKEWIESSIIRRIQRLFKKDIKGDVRNQDIYRR